MNLAEFLLALCRCVFDTSALLLWGMSAYLATLVPAGLREQIWPRLSGARGVLTFAVAIAVLGTLPLQAAIIGSGWGDALRPPMLTSIAAGTSIGTAWQYQLLGVLLLALWPRLRHLRVRTLIRGHAMICAGLLASLAITGHAAMDEGTRGVTHQLNDVVHVLAAGTWLGALPIVLMLLPQLQLGAADGAIAARQALWRFSTAGHVVVALVMLSGVASTLFILGGVPGDWRYPYQKLLVAKILIVTGMALLAIFNRYVLVPRMRRSSVAQRWFYWLTAMEILMSVIAIGLVAWFGTLEPS